MSNNSEAIRAQALDALDLLEAWVNDLNANNTFKEYFQTFVVQTNSFNEILNGLITVCGITLNMLSQLESVTIQEALIKIHEAVQSLSLDDD